MLQTILSNDLLVGMLVVLLSMAALASYVLYRTCKAEDQTNENQKIEK